MKKMSKKCSTDQSFIRKQNTTYKIGTLPVLMVERHKIKEIFFLYYTVYVDLIAVLLFARNWSELEREIDTHQCC